MLRFDELRIALTRLVQVNRSVGMLTQILVAQAFSTQMFGIARDRQASLHPNSMAMLVRPRGAQTYPTRAAPARTDVVGPLIVDPVGICTATGG
jgi:hypothetical protein